MNPKWMGALLGAATALAFGACGQSGGGNGTVMPNGSSPETGTGNDSPGGGDEAAPPSTKTGPCTGVDCEKLAECRPRLACRRPARHCKAPKWTGTIRQGINGPSSAAFGVAVGCDGVTHIAGSTLEFALDILARFDRTGALASAKVFAPNDYTDNALHTVKLDASGRRIYSGGFLHGIDELFGPFGVVGVMLPDDTIAWQHISVKVRPEPRAITVDVDAVGNIYLAVATSAGGVPHAVVEKVTAAGDLVWIRSLALVVGFSTSVGRIAVTPSGDVFLPVNGGGPSLVRLDTDGNVVWTSEVLALGAVQAVAVDALGNSAVAGTNGVGALDPAGNVRWLRGLTAAVPGGVALEPSGAVWIAGRTWGQLPGATSLGGADGFVARYGPDGTLLWTRQVGGPFDDALEDVTLDAAGHGVAAGSQARDDAAYVDRDVLLVRIAPDGTF